MNSFEQPHLFANGKFKLEWSFTHSNGNTSSFIEDILGWTLDEGGAFLVENDEDKDKRPDYIFPSEATLIARPISDMTDREVKDSPNYAGLHEVKWYKEWWERYSHDLRCMPSDDFLYLLSIGVYPFRQKHFHDGTVIQAEASHD